MKLATISASWHQDLIREARTNCNSRLSELGFAPDTNVEEYEVPGSLEIPLMAQRLAKTGRFAGIIAFGLIVDGGIYRHDFVATAVIDGLVRVGLDTDVPVFSCVLTPHHFHDSPDHIEFFRSHLRKKGTEVANSAHAFITQLDKIK